ncbi:MAG: thioredoxin-dependent thiol peroxidase [Lachnospiraceae bacterium]|jgi:peroxiredoxin Q/BCP|nr:thioredoxin-dependent thiol peroxidase [Lachnospiraceae bacterium]
MLNEGTKAPDFALEGKDKKIIKLSDFLGKKVIVYFYPKDNTPGCTKQACAFASIFGQFEEKGIIVIGISKDSPASHEKFATKYELPFLLLSDPNLEAIKAYDVWKEKKLYGKIGMGIVRSTYLIDETGMIEKVYEKVKPDKNPEEILSYYEEKGV